MRVAAIVASIFVASVAWAENPPDRPVETQADTPKTQAEPPKVPPEAPKAQGGAPASSEVKIGLISDVSYEPGVGVRYKNPKTTLVLYGLIEPTLGTVDNVDDAKDRQTGMQVSWFSGNRWGIAGAQSLVSDDSVKAIFRLESEYELPTGAMDTDNVLFNRDCWAGIESSAGKLTLGRQNTLARDFSQNYGDTFGSTGVNMEEGGWTNTNNFKQLIFFAGGPTGSRMNNGVVWKKAFNENLTAGLDYQFGNVPGKFTRNSSYSAALGLHYGPVNVSGFITEADHAGLNQHSYSIGGNYTMSVLRLNAGYFRYEASQGALGHRSDWAVTASAKIAATEELDLDIGYQLIKVDNAAYNGSGNTTNQFADTSTSTAAGSGSKTTTYGALVYHFSKPTQVYIAGDYMKLGDGFKTNGAVAGKLAAGTSLDHQLEVVAGMRIHF
jgi:predicted porin